MVSGDRRLQQSPERNAQCPLFRLRSLAKGGGDAASGFAVIEFEGIDHAETEAQSKSEAMHEVTERRAIQVALEDPGAHVGGHDETCALKLGQHGCENDIGRANAAGERGSADAVAVAAGTFEAFEDR